MLEDQKKLYIQKVKMGAIKPKSSKSIRLNIIEDFLKKNNLLPNNYTSKVILLKLPQFISGDIDNFSIYQVSITPTLDNLPVISNKESGEIISLSLNRNFSFFRVFYFLAPLQTTNQYVNIISPLQAVNIIKNSKIAPSSLTLDVNNSELSLSDIKISNIEKSIYNVDFANKTNKMVFGTASGALYLANIF